MSAARLFGAQGGDGVDGGGPLGGDDAGEEGADSQGEDGAGEDEWVPSFDLIELRGDEVRAGDRDRDAYEQADSDLKKSSAQYQADDV